MRVEKIDSSILKTYEMVILSFPIDHKDRKSYFLEETFLLVEISINIAFRMSFFTLSNANSPSTTGSLSRGHTPQQKPFPPSNN